LNYHAFKALVNLTGAANNGGKTLAGQLPMIRLVVNADGLGSSAAANRGILRAHQQGIVTSASVRGDCADLDLDAVRAVLIEAPGLGVGLTLVLSQGRPVAPASEIPTLLGPSGDLRRRPAEVALAWARGAMARDEVERELEAQVRRALDAGLPLDHLDTADHLGFLPGVGQIVEQLARRHRIPGMRSTVEPPTLAWLAEPARGLEMGVLAGLSWLTRRRLGALRHGPRTWGYMEAGRLDEIRILEIIGRMTPGAHELICTPRDGDSGDGDGDGDGVRGAATPAARNGAGELRALTGSKVRRAVEQRAITLCRWSDLF
jgi:predicted glycoside hydrolase/deacetylase ChbG (UPF0249 family)